MGSSEWPLYFGFLFALNTMTNIKAFRLNSSRALSKNSCHLGYKGYTDGQDGTSSTAAEKTEVGVWVREEGSGYPTRVRHHCLYLRDLGNEQQPRIMGIFDYLRCIWEYLNFYISSKKRTDTCASWSAIIYKAPRTKKCVRPTNTWSCIQRKALSIRENVVKERASWLDGVSYSPSLLASFFSVWPK